MKRGFEVLRAMTVKRIIHWGVTSYGICFRRIYCLHLQDQRINQASIKPEIISKQNSALWIWRYCVPPTNATGLHVVKSQNSVFK
jgi:hypothetical protein